MLLEELLQIACYNTDNQTRNGGTGCSVPGICLVDASVVLAK